MAFAREHRAASLGARPRPHLRLWAAHRPTQPNHPRFFFGGLAGAAGACARMMSVLSRRVVDSRRARLLRRERSGCGRASSSSVGLIRERLLFTLVGVKKPIAQGGGVRGPSGGKLPANCQTLPVSFR